MLTRVLIGCLFVSLTGSLFTRGRAADDPGQQAYADHCLTCHGAEGRGGGEAPKLIPFRWTYEETLNRVRHPECDMPAFSSSQLSDAQVRQIVAYLKTIK